MTKTVIELNISELQWLRTAMGHYRSDHEVSFDDPKGKWIPHEALEDKLNSALVDIINSTPITKEMFLAAVERLPEHDDLARCNCHDRGVGHSQCGWCVVHWKPRFMCGCR